MLLYGCLYIGVSGPLIQYGSMVIMKLGPGGFCHYLNALLLQLHRTHTINNCSTRDRPPASRFGT